MLGLSANEYRQFARQCTKWAAQTTTDQDREAFVELARDWTFAARVLERTEKQGPSRRDTNPTQSEELS